MQHFHLASLLFTSPPASGEARDIAAGSSESDHGCAYLLYLFSCSFQGCARRLPTSRVSIVLSVGFQFKLSNRPLSACAAAGNRSCFSSFFFLIFLSFQLLSSLLPYPLSPRTSSRTPDVSHVQMVSALPVAFCAVTGLALEPDLTCSFVQGSISSFDAGFAPGLTSSFHVAPA